MKLNFESDKPIYMQIAHSIEDDILKDIFEEEGQLMSTTEISINFKINPATAAKGINLLVNDGIVHKKRGVGMFVTKGAKEKILMNRKEEFYKMFILTMIDEAAKLKIGKDEIIKMIEGSWQK